MQKLRRHSRFIKGSALSASLALSLFAFNYHDGFYFTSLMPLFIVLITGLLLIEYFKHPWTRLVSGIVFLCALNNLADELFFDPTSFDLNEKAFAAIITAVFILNLLKIVRHGRSEK